jgi:uncharacterized protein YhaN
MRIETAHIADFGRWHDRTDELSAPVTLFFGPNEAGKSTMMAFYRFMLFGFPPRSKPDERYESRTGAGAGGTLTIRDGAGARYRLERYEPPGGGAGRFRLVGEDGERTEAFLRERLLGGLTGEAYRQLFAFGLTELQEVNVLHADELGGYLYTAGLGVRPGAILAAERKLQAEMDRLYRPRGKNQELFQAVERLAETRRRRQAWQSQAAAYDALALEWMRCGERIAELEAEEARLQERLRRVELLLAAYPHWTRRSELVRALAALPADVRVPADALPRLERLTARRGELADKRHALERKLQSLLERRSALEADPETAASFDALSACREAWLAGRARAERLKEVRDELARADRELSRILRQVDRHWTEAELTAFPVSIGERERVRRLKAELDAAEQAVAEWTRERRQWEQRAAEHDARREQLAERKARELGARLERLGLAASAAPGTVLEALDRLIERLEFIREQEEELKQLEARKRDLAALAGDGTAAGRRWDWLPLAAGGLLLIAIPAYFIAQHQSAAAGVSFLLLLLLNVGIYVIVSRTADGDGGEPAAVRQAAARLDREMAACGAALEEEYKTLAADAVLTGLQETAAALAAEAQAVDAAARSADRAAARTGTPDARSGRGRAKKLLVDALTLKEALRELVIDQAKLTAEMEREASLAREAAAQAAACAEHLLEAGRRLELEREAWREWLDERHLPENISPDTALHLFNLIEQGLQVYAERERLRETAQELTAEQDRLMDRIRAVIGDVPAERLEVELHGRLEAAKRHVKALETMEQLDAQIDEWRLELEEANDQLRRLDEERLALFREAGADDEAGFRRNAEIAATRARLEEALRQTIGVLESVVGAANVADVAEELAAHGRPELEAEHRALSERLQHNRAELGDLRERRGSLRREMDRLEQAEEPSRLAQQEEEEADAVRRIAASWSKRALALALIREARRRAEEEKQPAVLAASSHYFALMTGERYRGVFADWEARTVYAVRPDGERVAPARLSRGTVEQLFLAIRFALAEEQARRSPIPILMDDIFVNFDDERLEHAWRAVSRLAKHHQLLLFTCREAVAEAARRRLQAEELEIRRLP